MTSAVSLSKSKLAAMAPIDREVKVIISQCKIEDFLSNNGIPYLHADTERHTGKRI